MDKVQGSKASNSNSQYISGNKNLTPHSCGKNCHNGIENAVQIICSYKTIELKQSNGICPFSLNLWDYALMLMIKKPYTQNRKIRDVYFKVADFMHFFFARE